MWGYYADVRRRAWQLFRAVKVYWETLGLGLVLFLVGFPIYGFWKGWAKAMDELYVLIAFLILAGIGVGIVIYVRCLVIAPVRLQQDEITRTSDAERLAAERQQEIEARAFDSVTMEKLIEYRSAGNDLRDERVTNEEELSELRRRCYGWRDEICEFIREKISYAVADEFMQLPPRQPTSRSDFAHQYSEEHRLLLTDHCDHLHTLQVIIERYTPG